MKLITISTSEFELRNVADGEHTLRVFPSRPWHESYKNDGAFQMVKFTVRNGGATRANRRRPIPIKRWRTRRLPERPKAKICSFDGGRG
jgi:hypothetical protein